jgi:hypothetical protein
VDQPTGVRATAHTLTEEKAPMKIAVVPAALAAGIACAPLVQADRAITKHVCSPTDGYMRTSKKYDSD